MKTARTVESFMVYSWFSDDCYRGPQFGQYLVDMTLSREAAHNERDRKTNTQHDRQ